MVPNFDKYSKRNKQDIEIIFKKNIWTTFDIVSRGVFLDWQGKADKEWNNRPEGLEVRISLECSERER